MYTYICIYMYIISYYESRANFDDGQTEKTSRNGEYSYNQRISSLLKYIYKNCTYNLCYNLIFKLGC